MNKRSRESDYYEGIKEALAPILKGWQKPTRKEEYCHVEITANRKFSNKLKSKIRSGSDIIFNFLEEAAPDITAIVGDQYLTFFVVVEFKAERLKLDDIYQIRKYAELFDAWFALLVSTEEIPEELQRLSNRIPELLARFTPGQKPLTLVQFDESSGHFTDWFPDNPFESNRSWDPKMGFLLADLNRERR
jgi:hypothetical protein